MFKKYVHLALRKPVLLLKVTGLLNSIYQCCLRWMPRWSYLGYVGAIPEEGIRCAHLVLWEPDVLAEAAPKLLPDGPTMLSPGGRGCPPAATWSATVQTVQNAVHGTGYTGTQSVSQSPSALYRSSLLSWSGAWGRGLSFSNCMTQGCQEQLESPLMSISAVTHHCCRRHRFPKQDSLVLNSILAKTLWHSLYITSRQVSSGFTSLLSRTFQCLKNLCWDFLILQTLISERLGDKNPQETKISTASRQLCTYSAIYSQRTSGTQHHRIFWLGAHTGFAEQFCNKNSSTAFFFTCGACQVQAQDSKQFTWASPGCDSGWVSHQAAGRIFILPHSQHRLSPCRVRISSSTKIAKNRNLTCLL